MAKKSAIDQFLAEVLDTIPEDRRAAFEETLRDEKVSKAVSERVLARSDYSSKMDKVAEDRAAMEAYLKGENAKIQGWTDWYNGVVQTDAERQKQLDAYKSTFGELEAGSSAKPKFLTEEQYKEALGRELAQRDANAIKFADLLTDLKIEHKAEFGKRLDTDSLIEYATKNGLPLTAAYDRFTAEARQEKQEAAMNKRIEEAKAEGAREALSNHKLPYSSGPVEPHVLDIQKDVPKNRTDRISAAVADWNGTEHKSMF